MSILPVGPTKVLDFLPPRSWSNSAVPSVHESLSDAAEFYVTWLSDYLSKSDIPLSDTQQEFFLSQTYMDWLAENGPEGLGPLVAEAEEATRIAEASHEAGESWESFVSRQKAAFDQVAPEIREDLNFETEWCCDKSTWETIGDELADQKKCGCPDVYPDIPYRAYLALEVRALPEVPVRSVIRGFLEALDPRFR